MVRPRARAAALGQLFDQPDQPGISPLVIGEVHGDLVVELGVTDPIGRHEDHQC